MTSSSSTLSHREPAVPSGHPGDEASGPPNREDGASLQTCRALMVCLQPRRFVIVRTDEPHDLWPIDGGWEKIRQLQPGDRVVYRGEVTQVRAVEVYR